MKKYMVTTLAATIFFLLMGFSSLAAAGITSPQDQLVAPLPETAGNPKKMASSQNLPVVTLPEVICTAKRMPPLPEVLSEEEMKDCVAFIEMPKIRMVDFSSIITEIFYAQK